MQALYTLGLRQINNLNSEITRYGSAEEDLITDKASLNGQIVASLAGLRRTIDDYEDMAKKELVAEKQERAMQRVGRFENEYTTLRQAFEAAKKQQVAQVCCAAWWFSRMLVRSLTFMLTAPATSCRPTRSAPA